MTCFKRRNKEGFRGIMEGEEIRVGGVSQMSHIFLASCLGLKAVTTVCKVEPASVGTLVYN